jgi:hypothetical protein
VFPRVANPSIIALCDPPRKMRTWNNDMPRFALASRRAVRETYEGSISEITHHE